MKRILIVDDDIGSRESLRQTFSRLYDVTASASATSALKILESQQVDLMLLDVMMPEKDGLTLLKELQELHPDVPCIMVSASASVQPVVEAMKAGACDFVIKPFDVTEIRRIVSRTLETHALRRQVEILQSEVSREFPVNNLIGNAPSFLAALASVQKAAETDATVLIHGESGTGKELIARRLHALSSRRDDPFVPVHCAALPETLLESELFGHEKGAFTGADSRKPGRFDLAASGTLFFDEIGEMSLSTQVKLLRVIQEREYMRVGGTQVIQTNARLVTATSRNLLDEVARHTFRDDLYYRLNVIPIELPPLRERREDISLLARHFLTAFRQSMNVKARDFEPAALALMQQYSWPGNIRELRNIVERMSVLNGHHELIRADHLPEPFRSSSQNPPPPSPTLRAGDQTLADAVNTFERNLVLEALKKSNGIQTRAARLLGTTRRILNYRMRKLGITPRMTP